MKSEKEILEALRTLKSVCEENQQKCNKCILRNGSGECAVLIDTSSYGYRYISEWELKLESNPRVILN